MDFAQSVREGWTICPLTRKSGARKGLTNGNRRTWPRGSAARSLRLALLPVQVPRTHHAAPLRTATSARPAARRPRRVPGHGPGRAGGCRQDRAGSGVGPADRPSRGVARLGRVRRPRARVDDRARRQHRLARPRVRGPHDVDAAAIRGTRGGGACPRRGTRGPRDGPGRAGHRRRPPRRRRRCRPQPVWPRSSSTSLRGSTCCC